MSEFKKITRHLYTAKNQNGFKNALYDFFGAAYNTPLAYSKKEVREMIQNYPESYPTAFVIVDESHEGRRIYIETFDLDWEGHFSNSF